MTRTFPGPRPAGRLRRSKSDPVRFVFPRQDNFAGSEIGRTSVRPLGAAPGTVRLKVPKETLPPGRRPHSPRLPSPTSLTQGVRRRAIPVPAADAGDPSPAPYGPALRLHSGLGLTKGAKKSKATSPYPRPPPSRARGSAKGAKKPTFNTARHRPLLRIDAVLGQRLTPHDPALDQGA